MAACLVVVLCVSLALLATAAWGPTTASATRNTVLVDHSLARGKNSRAPPLTGCEFHCNTSLCGNGSHIEVRNHTFFLNDNPLFGFANASGTHVGWGCGAYVVAPAVDLSNRDITSFAPNALECWDFTAGYLGVVFDSNPLGKLPDASMFSSDAPAGAMFVSARNCSISTFTSEQFGAYKGGMFPWVPPGSNRTDVQLLALDISDNLLATLPSDLMGSSNVTALVLSVSRNRLTTIPANLFRSVNNISFVFLHADDNQLTTLPGKLLAGSRSKLYDITVANNKISTLPTDLLDGVFTESLNIDVSHNRLGMAGIPVGDFTSGTTKSYTVCVNI
jgi:hypothetical protein